jgi:predicted nucleic acid-binding protein
VRLRASIEGPAADLLVPPICDAEVVSALRRLVLRRTISVETAQDALRDYVDMPLMRSDHLPLLQCVLDLRHNFGAFDAMYAALAEAHGATLVTADESFARAVREHLALELITA